MSKRKCGLCERDPAAGFASVTQHGVETFYCHGDCAHEQPCHVRHEDHEPTCYERHGWLGGPWHPLVAPRTCHCGRPIAYGFDGDSTHHRGMCVDCDATRCDAYPMECPHREERKP